MTKERRLLGMTGVGEPCNDKKDPHNNNTKKVVRKDKKV
jgi:hypothetical protein